MKIKAEKWIVDEDDEFSYHIVDIEKCCYDIVNSKNIAVNSQDNENSRDYLDLRYSVKLCRSAYIDEYIGTEHLYETIKFCPFCGEAINIQIDRTIDKTKEVNQLHNEVKYLSMQCRKTDSKKEEKMLREQIEEINEKIEDIITDDDLKDYIK